MPSAVIRKAGEESVSAGRSGAIRERPPPAAEEGSSQFFFHSWKWKSACCRQPGSGLRLVVRLRLRLSGWFWLGLGLERGEVLTVGHLKRRLVDGRTAPRPLPRTHKHGGARRDAARIVRERRCAHAVLGGYPATAALGLLAYHHGERRLVRVRVGVRVKVGVGVGVGVTVRVTVKDWG